MKVLKLETHFKCINNIIYIFSKNSNIEMYLKYNLILICHTIQYFSLKFSNLI